MGRSQRETQDHPDWYVVLGVEPSATFVEIRAAYRRQALALHANRPRSTERSGELGLAYDRLNDLSDAYRTLRNPDTRRAYDLAREGQFVSFPESVRKRRPASRRAATRPGPRGKNRRRLGRIAVVLGFGLLVLWAVVTDIAERREVAAVLSSPSDIATTPAPEH